jgi:hypothetical protein
MLSPPDLKQAKLTMARHLMTNYVPKWRMTQTAAAPPLMNLA